MYKEKEIEAYFRLKIRSVEGLALKFTPVGFTGVPDRLVIGKG